MPDPSAADGRRTAAPAADRGAWAGQGLGLGSRFGHSCDGRLDGQPSLEPQYDEDDSLLEAGGALQGVYATATHSTPRSHSAPQAHSSIADALVVSGSAASSMAFVERERMGMGPLVSIEDEADLAAGRRLTSARHRRSSRDVLSGADPILSPQVHDVELAQALAERDGAESTDGPWARGGDGSTPPTIQLPPTYASAAAPGDAQPFAGRDAGASAAVGGGAGGGGGGGSVDGSGGSGGGGGGGGAAGVVLPAWERRGSGGQVPAAAGALAGVTAKGGAMSEKERALLAQIQKLEGQLAKEKVKKKVCTGERAYPPPPLSFP